MLVSERILNYLSDLYPPKNLPKDVETLNPYKDHSTWELVKKFYETYYDNVDHRVIVFGINPGRYGGGITGIPFTDPIQLEQSCGIKNDFDKRAELSSKFIYEVIHAYGGPEKFYNKIYISAISPLGYVRDGKNLNYYDIPSWKEVFYDYAVETIRKQLSFVRRDLAICIGQGQNLKFLELINDQNQFFDQIISLPHPRWVMQYRLKQKEIFIEEYLKQMDV